MKKLDVTLRRSPGDAIRVGTLADVDRRIYFEYDPAFIERGLQLSPFKLSLRAGLIEHHDRAFGPLPGLFDDSLPDGWGLLLMDRHFRRSGIDPATLSPLDRLAYVGQRGIGALTYHPPTELEPSDRLLDLKTLGDHAQQVLEGKASRILPEMLRAGGSPAGARPKVLVGLKDDQVISGEDDLPDGFEHWIVKFPAQRDSKDAAAVEFSYAQLAKSAGIDIPHTQLITATRGTRYFAVRRFDRPGGNRRLHVHTFANLIHANFRVPSTDYADLLKVTSVLTRNDQDVRRAFRQMLFNIVMHNRDDHAKNFAFIMNDGGEWSLSPAYDVVYSDGPGGEHTMTVLGEANAPTRQQCLKLAEQSGVKASVASEMIEEINAAATRWPTVAADAGCTRKTIAAIRKRIVTL